MRRRSSGAEEKQMREGEDKIRYIRQMFLPEVGEKGQEKLAASSVLIVGLGGLGSPVALYLSSGGVGRLSLVDGDVVEISNLHRQILYDMRDLGKKKAFVAGEKLRAINPDIEVETYDVPLTLKNVLDVIAPADVVVDGTDNFATRYLVNDACVLLGKPMVYGSIYQWEGQVGVFDSRRGPCFRCYLPSPPPPEAVPSCMEGGVVGPLPGIIGAFQALETMKILLGVQGVLYGKVLLVDGKEGRTRYVHVPKNPACPVCSRPFDVELRAESYRACETGGGGEWEISPQTVKAKLEQGTPILLLDVREAEEYHFCHLPGAKWIPLRELPQRLGELDVDGEIVCYCHTGGRSLRAAKLLRQMGFLKAWSMKGGIDRWAVEIDPNMPRY
ncbi:MAG: ThiF family adenylyltransferase [bacterium JZ-2024 1]